MAEYRFLNTTVPVVPSGSCLKIVSFHQFKLSHDVFAQWFSSSPMSYIISSIVIKFRLYLSRPHV